MADENEEQDNNDYEEKVGELRARYLICYDGSNVDFISADFRRSST